MQLNVPLLVPTAVAGIISAVSLSLSTPPATTAQARTALAATAVTRQSVTTPPDKALPGQALPGTALPRTTLLVTKLTDAGLPGTTTFIPADGSQLLASARRAPEAAIRTTPVIGAPTATLADAPGGVPQGRVTLAFTWPLSPPPAVSRRFERPSDQWARGHRGADLEAAVGQPVLSAGEGIVAFSGVVAGRGVLTIRHPGGLLTTYEPVDNRLAAGELVHPGSRIGVVSAASGHCAPATCIHWGARSGQTYQDPLLLLRRFVRPILLPLG